MFERKRMRFYGPRYAMVGMTILFLLVVTPLVSAEGVGSYSGDDAYDPAAGGRPDLSVIVTSGRSAPGAGISYSGDDAYDPAAGGRPELSVILAARRSRLSTGLSYSGDDAYDPAAGGTPELSVVGLSAEIVPPVDCGLSADEIAERRTMTVAGGFSGDDAYDPAAGGTPELSLLAFADASSLMAACEPVISND